MTKLYFLGGENVVRRDAQEVNALAFEDAGGAPEVLVFAWARPSFDRAYLRRKRLVEYFRSLGARCVEFAEFSDPSEEIQTKAERSDLLYLTGGQASTLLSRLKKSGTDNILRQYHGVIVGRSAGALVLGKNCLVTSRYSGTPKVISGLRFVDFSVKAHYKQDKDDLLRVLSFTQRIYGIPQRAAVVYGNGTLSFMGKVVLFENGEKNMPGY